MAGEPWRMTPAEQEAAMQRMLDDPLIADGWRPQFSSLDRCDLTFYPGGAGSGHPGFNYAGVLDTGCFVYFQGALYRIVGRAAVSKKHSLSKDSGSYGCTCWFLRPLGGGEIIERLWFGDLVIPGPLEVIALAAASDEELG